MHRRAVLWPAALAGGVLIAAIPGRLTAQVPSVETAAARLRLSVPAPPVLERRPASPGLLSTLPDTVRRKPRDHTTIGLLVGAGVGFIAGWAFYDTLCEAVDNNCSDSRLGLVALGTGAGAALGALIGSVAD